VMVVMDAVFDVERMRSESVTVRAERQRLPMKCM
jgi:hypothetical protein